MRRKFSTIVYWEHSEEGWSFSRCDKYSIVPSLCFPGKSELWFYGNRIAIKDSIQECKARAERHARDTIPEKELLYG